MLTPASPVPESMAAAATTDVALVAEADAVNTCRYPSKKCWNARALKRNGEMHNLCDEHRQKANKNQRRLEQKRKTSKKVVATKRTRKSRALKSKAAAAAASGGRVAKQPTKRQQQQSVPVPTSTTTAATELADAAHSLQQQLQLPQQTVPVHLNPTLSAGFFTDLMMSETLYSKQQLELCLLPHQRVPTVNDFLDGDLDSLTDCLDYSIPSFATMNNNSNIGCGMALGSGSSSPIDVCDGLDAVAAVNDFWWHPVVVVDPLLDTSALVMSDEIFALQH